MTDRDLAARLEREEESVGRLFIENYALEVHLCLALKRLGMTKAEFFAADGLDENGRRPPPAPPTGGS